MLHFTGDDWSPLGKAAHRVGLERVLVHGIAGTSTDAEILRGLQECRSYRQMVQLRAQAGNDLRGAYVAVGQRLERNVEGAGIGCAATAGKRNHVGDSRVFLDHFANLPNGVIHSRERGILWPANAALNGSRVLHREKTLGYFETQHHVERYCDD